MFSSSLLDNVRGVLLRIWTSFTTTFWHTYSEIDLVPWDSIVRNTVFLQFLLLSWLLLRIYTLLLVWWLRFSSRSFIVWRFRCSSGSFFVFMHLFVRLPNSDDSFSYLFVQSLDLNDSFSYQFLSISVDLF